jgi:hypothetical protein
MQGNTDRIPEDCSEEEFIAHHNDYSLFSLRNMLLEMSHESYIAFDTHLAQYVYEKLTDDTTKITMLGKVNVTVDSFHETLNTLEFCSRFMHTRCSHQEKDSILIANNFTRLENVLDPKSNTMPIKLNDELSVKSESASETVTYQQVDDISKLHNPRMYREVQISYLDNNCSSFIGAQNVTNFYEQKTIHIDSPHTKHIEGATGKIEIPHLRIGNPHEVYLLENSEIIEDSIDSSNLNSSHQFSLLSGESKKSLKDNIQ